MNTVTSSSDSFSLYTSTGIPDPSANAALPPRPHLQTFHPPSVHFASSPYPPLPPPYVSSCFSIPSAPSSPLTTTGFFNGMLEVSEPGALNNYTLSRLILLTYLYKGIQP